MNYTNSIDSTDFVGDHRPLQCRRVSVLGFVRHPVTVV